jgi:transcriptional regulator with XRE-family HTH domain
MDAKHFAPRLKELRQQAGLTQPALAEKAGLSKAGIANLEQGRREPSLATAVALAAALSVDVTQLTRAPASSARPGRGRPRKGEPSDEPPAKKSARNPKK